MDELTAADIAAMRELVDGITGFEHQHFDGGTFETNTLAELDEDGKWRTWDMNAPFSKQACAFIAAAPAFIRKALAALGTVPDDAEVARLRAELDAFEALADEREHPVNKATGDYQDNWMWWEGVAEGIEHTKEYIAALEAEVARLRRELAAFIEPM